MMRPWPQWHAYTLAPPLYITFSTSLAPAGIQDERCYIGETVEDSLYGECPCDSPEQFAKLSSQLNASYGYFMVDIKSLICADMGHFRRFEFRKGSVATVNGKNGNANGEK